MHPALAALVLASAAAPDCAPAAAGTREGTVAARVTDQAGARPLAGVTVVAAWTVAGDGAGFAERRATTDSAGRATLCAVPAGVAVTAWAQAGAVRTPRDVLRVEPGGTATVALRLSAEAVRELDAVRVTARAPTAREHEFTERRRRSGGGGQFMDEARIAALRRKTVTDLARSFSSVSMADDGTGRGPVLSTTRAGRACPIAVFLDGTPVNQMALDGLVTPDALVGIEYYAGFASPPAKYGVISRSQCGTMLLWTRSAVARDEDAR